MDTMQVTKIVGCLCAAMLFLLVGQWAASGVYNVGGGHGGGHGDDDELHAAYIIEVEETEVVEEAGPSFEELLASADIGAGEKVFGKCKSCHKIVEGENALGPHLYGVVGRDIAEVGDFSYSGPMADFEGDWTAAELDGFLANPKEYMPGTRMGFGGLKKPEDRANLIAYLDSLDD